GHPPGQPAPDHAGHRDGRWRGVGRLCPATGSRQPGRRLTVRVFLTPDRVELGDGNAVEIHVTVHNTGTLIGGYHLRVLGADPSWVTLETENLSLFPDTSETVRAVVRIPQGVAAGERRMAVQVRELTPPQAISI